MKRILLVSAVTAAALAWLLLVRSPDEPAASAADGQSGPASVAEVEERFVGNYDLVSFESFPEDGEVIDRDYVGRILYDEDGNMSAVGMPRDLPDRASEAEDETPRAGFAYFGSFSVDPEAGTVTHHVRGSPMAPYWVETDLVRYYELEDDLLMLSLRDEDGRTTGTLTWRRF